MSDELRLTCTQILQNLESRFTNEAVGWAIIILTIIMIMSASARVSVKPSILVMIFQALLAIPMYFSLSGLFSAYYAAKIVGAVIGGNTALPKFIAAVANEEIKKGYLYCERTEKAGKNKFLSDLENRSKRPITECIHNHILEYLNSLPSLGFTKPKIVAARIGLAIFSSGPFTELKQHILWLCVLIISIIVIDAAVLLKFTRALSTIIYSLPSFLLIAIIVIIIITLCSFAHIYACHDYKSCMNIEEVDKSINSIMSLKDSKSEKNLIIRSMKNLMT